MDVNVIDKLEVIERRYEELNRLMAQPEVMADLERLQALAKEQASIEDLVARFREYKKVEQSYEDTRKLMDDGLD